MEPWDGRVFPDREYRQAGALISNNLSRCNVIFGVKETGTDYLIPKKAYCFFSHTIKGQAYNMPMLRAILNRRCTLFDYELVRGDDGKRLLYFGDYAGYAGMIDSLWALGRRLAWEGIESPFKLVRYATEYPSLEEAEEEIRSIGAEIWRHGLPKQLVPFVCGFTGRGKVATGAQRLFDLLPVVEVEPRNLTKFLSARRFSDKVVYRVQFHKPDLYRSRSRGKPFDNEEFAAHPERYVAKLDQFIPHLTMIINGIYWEPGSPRLVTRRFIHALFKRYRRPRLRVIGDITCDIDGSIEITVKATDSLNPVYVFDPETGTPRDGWEGRGPVVLAVDKLPTELPREASESFGAALLPFVPELARARFDRPFEMLDLPPEFRHALITHRGTLLPKFTYLAKHL